MKTTVTPDYNRLRVGASERPTRRITDYGRDPQVYINAQGREDTVRINLTADQARHLARRLKAYADFLMKERP